MTTAVRRQWREFWASDVARAIQPEHLPTLRRLFALRDQWERAKVVLDAAFMVEGSMRQIRVNPALDAMLKLDASMLRLENELGLTPMSRARLEMTAGSAMLTLEELNRRAREARGADDDGPDADADPRAALLVLPGPDGRRQDAADAGSGGGAVDSG